jgi:hypothetical protein
MRPTTSKVATLNSRPGEGLARELTPSFASPGSERSLSGERHIAPVIKIPSSEPDRFGTAAQALIRALVDAGVETFFGIPGGPVSPLFEAVLTTRGARLVESRHESGAAFAAAMYYRASRRVGWVIETGAPGATNPQTRCTTPDYYRRA